MKTLSDNLFEVGKVASYGAAGALTVDAVHNYVNNNPQIATIELIAAGYLVTKKLIESKHRTKMLEFGERVQNEYVPQMKQIGIDFKKSMADLSNYISNQSNQS